MGFAAVQFRLMELNKRWTLLALANIAILFTYHDEIWMKTTKAMTAVSSRLLVDTTEEKKELFLLLSYPNSGADDIINAVEHATHQSMATNYGHIVRTFDLTQHTARYPSESIQQKHYKTGPWKNNVDFPATSSKVLVKTHCTGHCLFGDTCTRIGYIRNAMNMQQFAKSCAKSTSYNPDRDLPVKGEKPYKTNRIGGKSVILTRNPIAIVTNRFKEYATKKGINYDAISFYDWCDMIDSHYRQIKEIQSFRRSQVTKLLDMEGIPCYTEFLRIAIWYHRAMEYTSSAVGHERYVISYESFRDNPSEEMDGLLKYVGLTKVPSAELKFTGGKDDFCYTKSEIDNIGRLMKGLSKTDSEEWTLFGQYF